VGFNLFDPSSYGDISAGAALGTAIAGPFGGMLGGAIGSQGSNSGNPIGDLGHTLGDITGTNAAPDDVQSPYKVNYGAFNNPAGSFAPQLGSALGGYTQNAYQPISAATSPYTSAAGAGLGSLAGTYGSMAAGQGPSLATLQAQQQGAQNLAATESMLGSARGAGNPAAAQLAARNAQAQGQQQIAQNAIQGRTAEELGALSGLGSTYGALGGLGTTVQGQQNQIGLGNQALNAQVQNQYLQALAQQNAQQQQGAIAGQQLGAQNALGYSQLQSGNYQAQQQRKANLLGGLMQGGAGLAAAFA
jgi:hypothetical protein